MKKIIIVILLGFLGKSTYAQELSRITHEYGTGYVGNNIVKVIPEGGPSYALSDNIGPFRIGNKHRKSAYTFQFTNPVKKIQLHFTAINKGEKIAIEINEHPYNLKQSEILNISGRKDVEVGGVAVDGVLTATKNIAESCVIKLDFDYSISSVKLTHLNGVMDGCVFSIYAGPSEIKVTDGEQTGASSKITDTKKLKVFPNPTTGDFVLSGDAKTNNIAMLVITDVLGQKVFEQSIVPNNLKIYTSVHLGSSVANGVYLATLKNVDEDQAFQIVLQR